jgi:hypothetical protein
VVPTGAVAQVPLVAPAQPWVAPSQLWHAPPLQAVLQHRPMMQKPKAQLDPDMHAWPFASAQSPVGPQLFGDTQLSGSVVSVIVVQTPGLAVVLQS